MNEAIEANPDLGRLVTLKQGTVGNGPADVLLDDLALGMAQTPGFVKIDIDGGEVEALKSGERLFAAARPHVIVETHTPELEWDSAVALREYGYTPTIIHQRTFLPDYRPVEHNRWLVAYGDPRPLSTSS
jgi:hypothetical protein